MKHDILGEEDIAVWLEKFYDKLLQDPVTAPKFAHTHLPEHMPKIISFWAFVLLEKEGYKTNVFEKHRDLNLEKIHFERWLFHFVETTDELFEGPNAETAKQRAKLLATTFLHKISGEFFMF
jgi:hemoglobin